MKRLALLIIVAVTGCASSQPPSGHPSGLPSRLTPEASAKPPYAFGHFAGETVIGIKTCSLYGDDRLGERKADLAGGTSVSIIKDQCDRLQIVVNKQEGWVPRGAVCSADEWARRQRAAEVPETMICVGAEARGTFVYGGFLKMVNGQFVATPGQAFWMDSSAKGAQFTIADIEVTGDPAVLYLLRDGRVVELPLRHAGPAEPGRTLRRVYGLIDGLRLRKESSLGADASWAIGFGEPLQVLETQGEWMRAKCPNREFKGWVHSSCVTSSKALVEKMAELDIEPTAILYIADLKNATTFQLSVVEGRVSLGSKRAIAEHGNCVMLADEPALAKLREVSMEGLGSSKPLSGPKSRILYFYCSADQQFRPLEDLLAAGKKLAKGAAPASEPAAIGASASRPADSLPPSTGEMEGRNPVKVTNPNPFSMAVSLRSGGRGKDFTVTPNGSGTVAVPNGRYEIFFRYSSDPKGLYRGDPFTLADHGVEIRVVKVAEGNYRIEKVK